MDESIFPIKPYITRGYFRKGSRPSIRYSQNPRQKVCAFGALSEDGFTGMTTEKINQYSFKKFIQKLYGKFGKIVLLLDNASWHHAKSIERYVKDRDIILIFLPPYSPEINPIEQSWKQLKKYLSLKVWETLKQLRSNILTSFRQNKLQVKMYDYLRF